MRSKTSSREAPAPSISVVSTSRYSGGSKPSSSPSELRLPVRPRQVGRVEEALAGDHRGLGSFASRSREAAWRSSAAGPAPGAKPAGLHGEVAGEAAVELVRDRLQEARAEAVDRDHEGEADHQRRRGRRGPARVRAGRVGGEPALDRGDAYAAARRAPGRAARSRTARPARSRRRSRSCPPSPRRRRRSSSRRRRRARRRRRGRARSGRARAARRGRAPRAQALACRARRGSARSAPPGARAAARRGSRSAGRSRPRRPARTASAPGRPTGKSSARIELDQRRAPAGRRARGRAPQPDDARAAPPRAAPSAVIRPAVAPSVRSMPISRVRWKHGHVEALKIRKPPTKRAIAAKK